MADVDGRTGCTVDSGPLALLLSSQIRLFLSPHLED
jgi:hypothetical protein